MDKSTSISIGMMQIKYTDPHDDLNLTLEIWQEILTQCKHTFFQSASWVKCWLESLLGRQKIIMITGYYKEAAVFSLFVCVYDQHRNYFIKSKTANINCTGNSYYDVLYQEYNRIISAPEVNLSISDVQGLICKYGCDELKFERISNEYNMQIDNTMTGYKVKPIKEFKTYYIDLDKIRSSNDSYIKLLSANRRQQIRRSIRRYSEDQEIFIAQAENQAMALEMLEDLMVLHQKEWQSRGEPGAFSNNYFYKFHKELIKEAFNKDQIQILKIYTSDETIGYLYNFIYNNEVSFYQCGFNYSSDNKKRPGLVSHYKAILHNYDKGLSTYDFLSGDIQYKKSLSTDFHYMRTIKTQKMHIKFKVEDALISIRNNIKSLKSNQQVRR